MSLFFKKEKNEEKKENKEKINKRELLEGKLHCRIILEIAGRPVDYIKKAMQMVLKALSKEKGIVVLSKKSHKPKKIETIFSTFTEVEIGVEGLHRLIEIIFDYTPSSVEILEPEYLKVDLSDANNLVNDLAMKLHKAEAIAKRFGMENEILRKQIEELKKK